MPTRDLIIAFSGDEETGMLTTTDLATKHRALTDAEYALNSDDGGGQLDEKHGKPQYLSFVGAEKISATFELTVRNPGGHSSAPRADNAIYELADALKALQAYRFPGDVRTTGRSAASRPSGAGDAGSARRGHDALRRESEGRSGGRQRSRQCRPTSARRAPRVSRRCCSGGHASNALPQTATATVNCRIFPGTPRRRRPGDAAGSSPATKSKCARWATRSPATRRRCART